MQGATRNTTVSLYTRVSGIDRNNAWNQVTDGTYRPAPQLAPPTSGPSPVLCSSLPAKRQETAALPTKPCLPLSPVLLWEMFSSHTAPGPRTACLFGYIPGLGTLPPGKWSKISGLRSRQMGTAQLQLRMFPSSGSQGGQRHRCAGRAPEPNQRCESCLLGGTGGQGAEAAPAGRS